MKRKIDLSMIYEELEENQYKDMDEYKKQEGKGRILQQQSTLLSNDIDKKSGGKNQQQSSKPVVEKTDPVNIFEDKDIELIDTPIVNGEDSEENALT